MSDPATLGRYTYSLLCAELGEDEAKKIIVAKLRAFADAIERNGYPMIYSCEIENTNASVCKNGFIEGMSVTLSNPWPG